LHQLQLMRKSSPGIAKTEGRYRCVEVSQFFQFPPGWSSRSPLPVRVAPFGRNSARKLYPVHQLNQAKHADQKAALAWRFFDDGELVWRSSYTSYQDQDDSCRVFISDLQGCRWTQESPRDYRLSERNREQMEEQGTESRTNVSEIVVTCFPSSRSWDAPLRGRMGERRVGRAGRRQRWTNIRTRVR